MFENKSSILRRLTSKPLIIGPTTGKRVIPDAKNLFTDGIDGNFDNWGADEPGAPAKEVLVDVHELINDATLTQMFGSLSLNIAELCLSQDQILSFIENHRDWLRQDSFATFFLFRSHSSFFVAVVRIYSDGRLYAYVSRFEYGFLWDGENLHRLVAPRLEPFDLSTLF